MPINMSGATAYAAALRRYAGQITPNVERVVAAVAHQVEASAKSRAAVDTGAMRNSIGVDLAGTQATIGPTVSYAPYVEFGTSRMAPQPFMGPALEEHQNGFITALEAAVTQGAP